MAKKVVNLELDAAVAQHVEEQDENYVQGLVEADAPQLAYNLDDYEREYGPMVFRLIVEVTGLPGQARVATAFHLGMGYFATAAHVFSPAGADGADLDHEQLQANWRDNVQLVELSSPEFYDYQETDPVDELELQECWFPVLPNGNFFDAALFKTNLDPLQFFTHVRKKDVTLHEETALLLALLKELRLDAPQELLRPFITMGYPGDQEPGVRPVRHKSAYRVIAITNEPNWGLYTTVPGLPGYSGAPLLNTDGVVFGTICRAKDLLYGNHGRIGYAMTTSALEYLARQNGASPVTEDIKAVLKRAFKFDVVDPG